MEGLQGEPLKLYRKEFETYGQIYHLIFQKNHPLYIETRRFYDALQTRREKWKLKSPADVTSNSEYFGNPIYTYSLKQGIDDGFLAPYRVIRILLDIDAEGWRPPRGFRDKDGNPVENRIYNRSDFDKKLVVEERRKIVAAKVTEFLKGTNRFDKSIAFCCEVEHAEGMRQTIANENSDLISQNYKYIMRITGDNDIGEREFDNFTNPEEFYPFIATTSELMITGIDAQTVKVIVLDKNINSMTTFKQIIGR